jgi:predicted dehydrogenase
MTQKSEFTSWSRRVMLQLTGAAVTGGALLAESDRALASGTAPAAAVEPPDAVRLPKLFAATETESAKMPAPWPPQRRVGVAVVGLGRLALDEILPAFGESQRCRLVAVVSGDAAKARTIAAQYGIDAKSVYDYKTFDRLRDDANVELVYIALPNGLHAEFTVRAAHAGKHVLCEKPMANTVAECQQMIDACERAGKKLMIAYRMQYEPYNREAIRMARAGALGKLKGFSAMNGQTQGDPRQWRLKKSLAGGGALVDVGIYCLNAARYLSGEEPIEVAALQHSTPNDPRFAEVEEQVDFVLRFPSGLMASCTTSYGYHNAKRYRLVGESAFVELDPAFPYRGQSMRVGRKADAATGESLQTLVLAAKNQFALEMDHMAERLRSGQKPHTPGEEGMQDMKLIAAIYQAAKSGHAVSLPAVSRPDAFRGPAPAPQSE